MQKILSASINFTNLNPEFYLGLLYVRRFKFPEYLVLSLLNNCGKSLRIVILNCNQLNIYHRCSTKKKRERRNMAKTLLRIEFSKPL